MKVSELMTLLDAQCVTEGADLSAEISCGYSCDLLSWVLAHGKQGMGWCTVQTHVNVIAVSVLMEMACVILVEGVQAEEASLNKAVIDQLLVWLVGDDKELIFFHKLGDSHQILVIKDASGRI